MTLVDRVAAYLNPGAFMFGGKPEDQAAARKAADDIISMVKAELGGAR